MNDSLRLDFEKLTRLKMVVIDMTRSRSKNETPWWESELPVIRRKLNAYLSWRLPAWRADYDDLLNDAFLGLTLHVRRHASTLPESWFHPTSPQNEAERSHLYKLAMVILRRRIADLFRMRASLPSLLENLEEVRDVSETNKGTPERQIMLRKILEVTRSVLDEMHPEDRDLIALVSGDDGFRKGLNARDRQRLARARKKLRDAIAKHLGADVADLLRIKV